MIKFGAAALMRQLEREGFRFKSFSLVNEGDYTVDDADWNYKDVPHLHYIHKLVEAHPAGMDDKFIATINAQKVLGLKIPLTIFNYESGQNEQTYFTSFVFFVLIIRTAYEALGPIRCRVTTTYNFGAPKWLLFLFPLARWVLKRNYDDLMSGDIPMRTRRGELRKWGAEFLKPGDSHSFQATLNTSAKNVVPASEIARRHSLPFQTLGAHTVTLSDTAQILVGRSDEFGLRLVKAQDEILAFPRLCQHEGACLDEPDVMNDHILCPWHGRKVLPVFRLRVGGSSDSAEFELGGERYTAKLEKGGAVWISPLNTVAVQRPVSSTIGS
jgi:nitrite reductase/ring-hydroxylating ferredoxin subunit